MPVLGNAAGQKNREWHHACCKQGYEYHVWTGFRDEADECGKQNHEGCVVADPSADVHILQPYAQHKENPEGPGKYHREMFSDYMMPEMFFHKMVRRK